MSVAQVAGQDVITLLKVVDIQAVYEIANDVD